MDDELKAKRDRDHIARLLFSGIRGLIRKFEAEYDIEIRLLEANLVRIDDDFIYDEPDCDDVS